jgi:cysteine-rich repeat protein
MAIGAALLLAILIPATATALTEPTGPNFRVNTVDDGPQSRPSVGAGGGGYVVVWTGPAAQPVLAQRLDGSGARIGGEFTVTSVPYVFDVDVAVAPSGDFLVVWDRGGIYARLYDAAGVPQGPEFLVNTAPGSNQFEAAVAADGLGNYIVTWTNLVQDGEYEGVFGQRLNAMGAPLGSEFQVNTYTTGGQQSSDVAADAAGNFVVAWEATPGFNAGGQFGIFAQRFDGAGLPLGAEFQVTGFGKDPSTTRAPAGDFVVAWANYGAIKAQRFASAGTPLGPPIQVNSDFLGSQVGTAADAAGDFVVVWRGLGIRAARFESDGTPQGSDFQLSTYNAGNREWPSIAGDGAGNFLAVWEDDVGRDIIAQRFSGGCGNGAVQSGEACDDGNNANGDGCARNCEVEACFTCSGAPSSCAAIVACTAGDGCCAPGCTPANDLDCPHLISGSLLSITDNFAVDSLIYKSRDAGIDTTVGTGMDPIADGAFLQVYNATGFPSAVCFELKTSGTAAWQERRPTAAGRTFAYKDNDQAVGPCKVARVRGGQLLKVKCTGAAPYPLSGSPEGAIGVAFTSSTSRYCSLFGGVRRDNNDFFLASGAPAPSACVTPPLPCPLTIPLGP